MTTQQLGFLGGLAAVACLLFSCLMVLIVRRGLNGSPANPAQKNTPAVVLSTFTPVVTPTITPTQTLTPIPYEQLIPLGWVQYKTALIEIWMPSEYKKASAGAVTAVSGKAVTLNLGLISTSKTSTYKPTVSISYEPLAASTLEEFIDQKLADTPLDVNIAERRKVTINSVDAYRIVFETHTKTNIDANELLFVFQDGGTVWYVKYSAEIKEFFELLPIFEESVKTFRIVR
jgi:hypothetical protein